MFIKNLTIKNFRCFDDNVPPIELNIPDEINPGSGLNIFVGENGTGKTTVLETVNYLTESQFTIQNKVSASDFFDVSRPIRIETKTDRSFEYQRSKNYSKKFTCNGLYVEIECRKAKTPGKLLLHSLTISNKVVPIDESIEEFHKLYEEGAIQGGAIEIFYFDKNRARHITKGIFKTTFS